MCLLGLETKIYDRPFGVTNPIWGLSNLCMICRGLVLSSHDCSFVCDCFVLNFAGFGIILGINWLKSYAERVNCEKLEVRVGDVEGRKVLIRCKREEGVFVSYMYSLRIP